ncbi:fatty acid--CoA ligase family protein [Luedemannella helvata]|uniref:Long-chain fatty acid--CoA ligase n=1 Tax=Luedemannella helvata TaxID=349315 RepID=A0ABP4VXM3_9ACTN
MSEQSDLADRIRAVLAIDPDAPAVEYHGTWYDWRSLATVAVDVERRLRALDTPGIAVGVVLRNDPAIVGAVLGVLLAGGCVVTISAHQGDAGLEHDLKTLLPPVVVALRRDWDRDGARAAAAGALGLRVGPGDATAVGVEIGEPDGAVAAGRRPPRPEVAIEMLTSGTTGPPKRVPLGYRALGRAIFAAGRHYSSGSAQVRLGTGVAIISSPMVHMSGLFRTVLNICQGRRIALMDRFQVAEFAGLVQRHRPKAVSLVPAALAMVLDADVPAAVFDSVKVVTAGTSHLPVDLQRRFEERYQVAVMPSYGATEFAGGVAGWNLPLYREWGDRKRGSVGRPQGGRELRVVTEDGEPLPAGERGLLEVRTSGDASWVRTTDLAHIDEDGFLFIDGRADDVIIRGGFKITPATIVDVLRQHPAVRDAGVVGIPDARLGAVPVAAVELVTPDAATEEDLIAFVRGRLTGYQVPVRVVPVDALPRTDSLKVSQPMLRTLLQDLT